METIRAFIAVDIGDEIRTALDELQRKLKKTHANVRWVKPGNMHLTLAFLGDLAPDKIEPLGTALDGALRGKVPFELVAAGTGTFGKPSHPRVVWAGINGCPALLQLHAGVLAALLGAGVEYDHKPFSPHLTLGRVKGPEHSESLLQKIGKFKDSELGRTTVGAVELIQSSLAPHGAEYSVLHRADM
jgi:2'-5' RNA ligase